MFRLHDHINTTFTAVIENEDGDVLFEFEMMDLSYNRWNEIGFMVTSEPAPKVKDPKNPQKYIDDFKQQQINDAIAENKRNAMRIVESLEQGGGIDWGDNEPATLEAKATRLMDVSPQVFVGLLGLIRNRVFGGRISEKDAEKIFPAVPETGRNGHTPETDDD